MDIAIFCRILILGDVMGKYKYLFFDLDGTIIDSFEGVAKSFAYALEGYGIYVKDLSELLPVLGPPLIDSFENIYGFSHEKGLDAVKRYRERYFVKCAEESRLYDGIENVLSRLYDKGFKIVLATSKPDSLANLMLEHYGLTKYFHFIGGASMDQSRDSKVKVIEHILKTCSISDMSEIVMIGDRNLDLLGAQSFGIDAIGVLYGYAEEGELENSPHVFLAKNTEELYNYIVGEETK